MALARGNHGSMARGNHGSRIQRSIVSTGHLYCLLIISQLLPLSPLIAGALSGVLCARLLGEHGVHG